MAMVIRMTIIVTTTISSTKVKPRKPRRAVRLPGAVASPIGSLLGSFAVDVKDVLSAPTGGVRIVLIAAHAPLTLAGERIDRNPAQEAHFLIFRRGQLLAIHQDVERLRIPVRALLDGAERI